MQGIFMHGMAEEMLLEMGKYQEALESFDKFLELDPNDVDVLFVKGYSLMLLGKNQEALKCYEKALELDPDFEAAKKAKSDLLLKIN